AGRAAAATAAGAATARVGAVGAAAAGRGDVAARVRADVVLAGLLLGVDRLHVLHHLAPDQRGEGASVDGQAAELGLHRGVGLRVAAPDAGRDVGGAAADPGVAVVLGGARLAPGVVAARLGALTGSLDHVQAQDRPGRLGDAGGDRAHLLLVVVVTAGEGRAV